MPLKRMKAYTAAVKRFLEANRLRFSFQSRRGEAGATLWDCLWNHHCNDHCNGPIYDYLEADIASRAEQAKPGGDYREAFEEWCGWCEHCSRGKNPNAENNGDLREEWARADVDDDLSCYHKRSKARRSKCGVPIYFDFLDDVDDNLEVARVLGVVELSPRRRDKLNALWRADNYEAATVFEQYWMAQGLMEQLSGAGTDTVLDVDNFRPCPNCEVANERNELRAEPAERPLYRLRCECYACGESRSVQTWEAYWRYLQTGQGHDLGGNGRYILTDLGPASCGERAPVIGRIRARPWRELWPYAARVMLQCPFEAHNFGSLRPTGACEYDLNLPEGLFDDEEVSVGLCFHVDGRVTIGNWSPGTSAHWQVPDRALIEFMATHLSEWLQKEKDDGRERERRPLEGAARLRQALEARRHAKVEP